MKDAKVVISHMPPMYRAAYQEERESYISDKNIKCEHWKNTPLGSHERLGAGY